MTAHGSLGAPLTVGASHCVVKTNLKLDEQPAADQECLSLKNPGSDSGQQRRYLPGLLPLCVR